MFAAGIGLYFFAHAGYLAYALSNGKFNLPFTAIVLFSYLVFFFWVLWPAIDEPVLLFATLVYLLISCFSLGASVNMESVPVVKWSYFIGIAFILFSDTIISFKEFYFISGIKLSDFAYLLCCSFDYYLCFGEEVE